MTQAPKLKILHVITGLDRGGAETMLWSLLSRGARDRFAPTVISLTDIGPVGDRIRELGIPVLALGMPRGRVTLRGMGRLIRRIRELDPDVMQGWMYHANVLGGIAARLAGRTPVLWGIHHAAIDSARMKRSTIWTIRVAGWLSSWASDWIVYCAEEARRVHHALGYARRDEVIANGFDMARFQPDPESRRAVRAELGIPEDSPLIGLVARLDPLKDHATFLAAAALLRERRPHVHFLLCGEGITPEAPQFREAAEGVALDGHYHLLGRREDVPRLQAALDIATSASVAEAFPLAIGEAMACGVPCVVTDVGDSARLVGETGRVVPPRSPEILARAWEALLDAPPSERERLGQAARRRVGEHFDILTIVARYEALYTRASERVRFDD